jgi:hypothetical protein
MKAIYFPIIVLLAFTLACQDSIRLEPLTLSTKDFSLDLTNAWWIEPGQGIDTYVGIFTDGHQEIRYDYGYFAFHSVDLIVPDSATLYFEETLIDGFPAKLLHESSEFGTTLFLYIETPQVDDKAKLWIHNPEDLDEAITSFKSFRFL